MRNKIGNIFKGDKVVWMVFFLLCLISLVEVFSASSSLTYKTGNYLSPIMYHGFLILVGLAAVIFTLNIKCRYYKIATPFLFFFSLCTLVWVLVAGVSTNGAQRWCSIMGIQFQPSEIAKGTVVLIVAQILSAMQMKDKAHEHAMPFILIIAGVFIFLIMLENFSTAALLALVVFMMMFIGRVPKKQMLKLMGAGAAAGVLALTLILLMGDANNVATNEEKAKTEMVDATDPTSESATKQRKGLFHRADTWKARIIDFTNTKDVPADSVDLRGKGAQKNHAKIAIASSNVVGRGPGQSVERDFLSQAFSDFIYAIIIEEMGILGAIGVLALYIILLFRASRIAARCENSFPAFLVLGLALLLVTQAIFNMAVAVGLAPVTGQPLPLISKGGTSTVINCVYIGAILSVSRTAKKRKESPLPAYPERGGE